MPVISAQVALPHENGDPADTVVNTFHFDYTGILDDLDNIRDLLQDFYTSQPPGVANPISAFFASTVLEGNATVTLYNLNEPKPRAPIYTDTFSLNLSGSTSPLPNQCAVCMTYQTTPASGQVQARFRNRVYLGPWKSTVVDPNGFVGNTLCDTIGAAAAEMLRAAAASVDVSWKVFSPTRAALGSAPEDGLSDVDGGWVDNSFDIQRRRKVAGTLRHPWDENTGT